MIFIDKNSATEGKKLLESHLLNARNGKKVSVGLIVQLALKVVQQKIRHTVLFFSVIAARCMCGILSWIILFLGSMFFATKIVYSTKHSCKKTPVPVPECLLDTIPEQPHKCRHQTALVRPVPKPTPISSDAFYDCVEETSALKKEQNTFESKLSPSGKPEIIKNESVETSSKEDIDETINKVKTVPLSPVYPAPLVRRLSNVERFLKESSPEPQIVPRENSRMLLGIVYSSCAFVAVQFYVLIATLLSTSIPFGLMFLVVCLCIIVGLITQICFYPKLPKQEKVISRKRRRDQSVVNDSQVDSSTNKIILECERRGKPVAPVKPFRLVRIPSTKELFSGIEGLKHTMNIASDLLKKKKI